MRGLEHATTAAADTAEGTTTPTLTREPMVTRPRIIKVDGIRYTIRNGRLHWESGVEPADERWSPDLTRDEVEKQLADMQAYLDLYDNPTERVPERDALEY